MRTSPRHAFLLGVIVTLAGAAARAQSPTSLPLTWQAKGMQAMSGMVRQLQCALSDEQPAELKTLPAGLEAPLFGTIRIGPDTDSQAFFVCVDHPKGQMTRLWVDTQATGELILVKEWARVGKTDAGTGSFVLSPKICGATREARFTCATVDPKDGGMAWARNKLLYSVDCGWSGDLKLGAKTFSACIIDLSGQLAFHHAVPKRGTSLLVDLNSDKRFDRAQETFDLGAPFITGGSSWRFVAVDAQGAPQIEPIDLTKARLEVGKPVSPFKFTLTDGRELQFPRDFAGKVVYFDFWALWCPYCPDEIPGLLDAHKALADKGLQIVGVNLDGPDRGEAIRKACTRAGMTWDQVYTGLGWDSPLAPRFEVAEIPYGVLLDGTTGNLLALDVRADDLKAEFERAKAGH